jgi:hypothetical protein
LYKKRRYAKRKKDIITSANIFCFQSPRWLQKYYLEMEKICYTVVMSAGKLHYYFKTHRVRVLTNQPLNNIFGNRDSLGRIRKWAMELFEHVVDFEKKSAIKSHVLADFIADWTQSSSYTEGPVIDTPWKVYCDRA